MAPPTIAPPMRPAARRGDAALGAGRGRSERTGERCDRDEGSKCLLHVFGSPEVAPWIGAGFKVTHTPYSKLAVSLESAQPSIESKRREPWAGKEVFSGQCDNGIPENAWFPEMPLLI